MGGSANVVTSPLGLGRCIRDARKRLGFNQMQLAKQRGESHIGSDSRVAAEQHRQEKQLNKQQQRKKAD